MATRETNQGNTWEYYVSDLSKLLKDYALDAKKARDSTKGGDFESGRLLAYNEVISLMQQQARAFGLPLEDVGLAGIDPDNDLV